MRSRHSLDCGPFSNPESNASAGREPAMSTPPVAADAAPAFLTVEGLRSPPPGELVLVLQKRGGWLGLFRRSRVFQAEVEARRLSL